MNTHRSQATESNQTTGLPNGFGAAALLAAGIGAFVLAALAATAIHVPSLAHLMIFYKPTGPLSGVTTSAILVWLAVWAALSMRWKQRVVALRGIVAVSLLLLALSLVLTFPPVIDLL